MVEERQDKIAAWGYGISSSRANPATNQWRAVFDESLKGLFFLPQIWSVCHFWTNRIIPNGRSPGGLCPPSFSLCADLGGGCYLVFSWENPPCDWRSCGDHGFGPKSHLLVPKVPAACCVCVPPPICFFLYNPVNGDCFDEKHPQST